MSPSKVEGGGEGLGMYFASLNFKYGHFRFLGGVDHFPVGIHSILCHLLSFYAVLCGYFKVMSLVEILPKQARTSHIAFC